MISIQDEKIHVTCDRYPDEAPSITLPLSAVSSINVTHEDYGQISVRRQGYGSNRVEFQVNRTVGLPPRVWVTSDDPADGARWEQTRQSLQEIAAVLAAGLLAYVENVANYIHGSISMEALPSNIHVIHLSAEDVTEINNLRSPGTYIGTSGWYWTDGTLRDLSLIHI